MELSTENFSDSYKIGDFPPKWIKLWANGQTVPTGLLHEELKFWATYWFRDED